MSQKDDEEGGHQLQEDQTKRKEKLQQLVDSIMATKRAEKKSVSKSIGPYTRSGRGRGKRSEYKVPIGWQHFSKGKYRTVTQRNGGGTRYIYRNAGEDITVREIIEEGKSLYFKEGKCKFGLLEEMGVSLVTSSGQNISEFTNRNGVSCSFTEYVKAYGLYPSQCHLYLQTKTNTDTCLKNKEKYTCFLVNNIQAGTLEISYTKEATSMYDDSTCSVVSKSYKTCLSLANNLEEYNVFEDGYKVNGIWKGNIEYLVEMCENVYNFPQFNSDGNKVVCFIHGPDIIHGSETDDMEHLIIGCLTTFHNKGHIHNWYKDGELVDSGLNHCILRIAEPGTYTVEVEASHSVTLACAPLSVSIHSETKSATESLMTEQNQLNMFSGHTLQQTTSKSPQPNQSSVFLGQTLQQITFESAQPNQSNVFAGHTLQQTTIESAQPNQSSVSSELILQQTPIENAQPNQSNMFPGQTLQHLAVESVQQNQSNVSSGHTSQQTTVESAQPDQSKVLSGQTLQQTTVESAQPDQSNVLSGQTLQQTTVEHAQPDQSNVLSEQTLQPAAVESMQPKESEVFPEICVPRITMDQVELLEQIGQGAFGMVFRGTWLGTVVAAKRITVKRMRLLRSMVIREISVHSRLHHPNIVQLMAFAIEGSELYLISEYIEGRNLDEMLFSDESCTEMSVDKKIEICLQILRAIAYLHNQTPKIIHRDIKPENILVSNNLSKVYVCDMGLSKIKTMNTLVTTFAGSHQPGTPAYKAPELESGSACTMSDIWSLSCTLVELFIEDCVWRSDMDENDIKQQKIKRKDPDGLNKFLQLNNISDNIKDTIRKGLSYLPLERPTALEMLAKFLK